MRRGPFCRSLIVISSFPKQGNGDFKSFDISYCSNFITLINTLHVAWLLGAEIIISETLKIKMNFSETRWDFDIPFSIARECDLFDVSFLPSMLLGSLYLLGHL